jgi:hypothetical protein
MSVAVAITVTLPNTTAAKIVATGTDVTQTIGREVTRLLTSQVVAGENQDVSGATVATVIT